MIYLEKRFMNRDATQLSKVNVTDTCAVWNILSSNHLYSTALKAGIQFMVTPFILYECLYKERKSNHPQDIQLKERLKQERENRQFQEIKTVSIDDLQKLDIIQNRKRLSKGELTAVASVLHFPLAGFITDDMGARIMAEKVIESDRVRTTPMLLGWLFYHDYLSGSDIDLVTNEHTQFIKSKKDDLTKFFYSMYGWATQRKLMDQDTN
jgi:hypothetical protein